MEERKKENEHGEKLSLLEKAALVGIGALAVMVLQYARNKKRINTSLIGMSYWPGKLEKIRKG